VEIFAIEVRKMNYSRDHIDQIPQTNPPEMLRRQFFARIATMVTIGGTASLAAPQPKEEMYGEIGKIIAVSGKRDELIANIPDGIRDMPGCLSYVVAKDASSADAVWISEVWDSKASHDKSLSLPSVKVAIAKNRPLIAGFGDSTVTMPVGGLGLNPSKARNETRQAKRQSVS
jgi:quinol monooxygenase YgiN